MRASTRVTVTLLQCIVESRRALYLAMLQCFTMLILCQEYRLSLPLLMPALFPGSKSSTSCACASMLARLSRARSNARLPETRKSQKGKRQGGTQEGKLLHLEVTQSVPPALEGRLTHWTSVHVVRTVFLYSATKRLETCVSVFCLCKVSGVQRLRCWT